MNNTRASKGIKAQRIGRNTGPLGPASMAGLILSPRRDDLFAVQFAYKEIRKGFRSRGRCPHLVPLAPPDEVCFGPQVTKLLHNSTHPRWKKAPCERILFRDAVRPPGEARAPDSEICFGFDDHFSKRLSASCVVRKTWQSLKKDKISLARSRTNPLPNRS